MRTTERKRTAIREGGELETRWLKASTGRVTDLAFGPPELKGRLRTHSSTNQNYVCFCCSRFYSSNISFLKRVS